MSKGVNTKEHILKVALDLTSKFGLESLSIGDLAKKVGMSKSGLFGHFKSKEKLQIMVLDYAAENFVKKVITPALKEPRGLERLDNMMANWKRWSQTSMAGGCPFVSSIVEFDDRPGKVRDHVKNLQGTMIKTFERAFQIAIEEGQLRKESSSEQMAYELYSNMIGFHIYSRLLGDQKAEEKFNKRYEKLLLENEL